MEVGVVQIYSVNTSDACWDNVDQVFDLANAAETRGCSAWNLACYPVFVERLDLEKGDGIPLIDWKHHDQSSVIPCDALETVSGEEIFFWLILENGSPHYPSPFNLRGHNERQHFRFW